MKKPYANPIRIVGLAGMRGAGKDTCAEALVTEGGFIRLAFADALYAECAAAYGADTAALGNRATKELPAERWALKHCRDAAFVKCVQEERQAAALKTGKLLPQAFEEALKNEPLSPRTVMQYWGTEYRRKRGTDSYWTDIVKEKILESPSERFVITDVRFPNELTVVRSLGGIVGRIRRKAIEEEELARRAIDPNAAHGSETEFWDVPVDFELWNEEGAPSVLHAGILAQLQANLEIV